MTVEETVLEKVKVMPMNRKLEVLDFVEFIESKEAKPKSPKEFRVRSKRMGFRKDLDYDKTSKLLEKIEGVQK
ncbi:MAG: hypothetical protein M3Q78_01645 [Acidobacteriota bacterium]|nr:hypothetical protein [Acidobacteriota bacterium]